MATETDNNAMQVTILITDLPGEDSCDIKINCSKNIKAGNFLDMIFALEKSLRKLSIDAVKTIKEKEANNDNKS
jgi:hypothetical protein